MYLPMLVSDCLRDHFDQVCTTQGLLSPLDNIIPRTDYVCKDKSNIWTLHRDLSDPSDESQEALIQMYVQEVEASLRRDLPIITTPHAKSHLAESKINGEAFNAVHDLDFFQDMLVNIVAEGQKSPAIKVTGMPGKHVAPGVVGTLNDLINAVSPYESAR